MNKKLIILFILTAALAITAGAYFRTNNKFNTARNHRASRLDIGVVKKNVDVNQIPVKFPTDIPIEAGAKITQNYNATAPDGRFQATRVFETKATLADNLTLYKAYLVKAGYKIQSMIDQPTLKMVYGTKDNGNLQVSIDENSQSHIKTVNISYTEMVNGGVQGK